MGTAEWRAAKSPTYYSRGDYVPGLKINCLERLGKKCRLLAGQYTGPSLRDWDVGAEMVNIAQMDDLVGLSKAILVGVTKERVSEDQRHVIPFDPNTCPMEKAPKYVVLCQHQIEAYNDCLQRLNTRIDRFHAEYRTARNATETTF